jgi:hypothetical protein
MPREASARQRALTVWRALENLIILGPDTDSGLPIFSFLIRQVLWKEKKPQLNIFLNMKVRLMSVANLLQ